MNYFRTADYHMYFEKDLELLDLVCWNYRYFITGTRKIPLDYKIELKILKDFGPHGTSSYTHF